MAPGPADSRQSSGEGRPSAAQRSEVSDAGDAGQHHVDHALDVFGPERTMYGGDWPFALLAADSYTEIWRDLRACLDDLDHADRHTVLAGTAQRTYRLVVPALTTT